MRKILLTLSLVLALGVAGDAGAYTLQANAQCVGGTLIDSYTDVQDGGGIAVYNNAQRMAESDCQFLSPAGTTCCSVHVSTNGGGFGGTIIPYTWFNYEFYAGATVQGGFAPYQTGPLANAPGTGMNSKGPVGRQGKYFAGPASGGAVSPASVTAALVANPNSIFRGEQSLLSWSSTGAQSCTGTNFSTGGATSGSVVVQPLQTTQYSVSCAAPGAQTTSPPSTAQHTEGELFTSAPVKADMLQNGGVNFSETTFVGRTLAADQTTMNRVCYVLHGAGATATNIGARGYSSCGNNGNIQFNGTAWASVSGCTGAHLSGSFSCIVPGTTSTTPGQNATASATVTVSTPSNDAEEFTVSCRAHPTQVAVDEDVLWSSTVTGGPGMYTYAWSGSEGLTGSANQVFKKYAALGQKTASLTVTFTPGGSSQQQPSAPPPASTPPPSSPTPPPLTVPPAAICPAIGWVVPVSPCSGIWAPTYSTGGCQNGWQCVPLVGTGGGLPPQDDSSFLDSLQNLLNFESPQVNRIPEIQTVDGSILGVTAAQHTEGELFTSGPVKADMLQNGGVNFSETTFVGRTLAADQTTMNRVCFVLHGAGSTATNIGARGYSSCGNNGNIQYNGSRWASVSGCTGAHLSGSFSCLVPAPPPPPPPPPAATCPWAITEGEFINCGVSTFGPGPDTDTTLPSDVSYQEIPGTSVGTCPNDEPASSLAEGTKCSWGVIREPDFRGNATCTLGNYSACVQPGGTPPRPQPEPQSITVQCENAVTVRTAECSDGLDNDGDGDTDYPDDPECSNPDDDDEDDTTQCSDGSDNDGDNRIDYGPDPGCASPDDDDETDGTGPGQCSDNRDNDGDGLRDEDDPGCHSGPGDSYNPDDNSETGGSGAQCSDGVDNNGDGNVDYPDDPNCSSANDNSEFGSGADLTISANPPLIKKNQSCNIILSARNVSSCSLTGPGVSQTFVPQGTIVETTQIVTPSLAETTTYTFRCTGLDGNQKSKTVDCKIAPTFEEF